MSAEWFAGRLRELREQAGLTQHQLGGKAGLSQAGIADLEQGRRKPAWETVVALCRALGVTPDAFLQEPRAMPERRRGRPRKAGAEPAPKRPRGRPRKDQAPTRAGLKPSRGPVPGNGAGPHPAL
jgi:transcriptional regulator with XRE-family HTH domain